MYYRTLHDELYLVVFPSDIHHITAEGKLNTHCSALGPLAIIAIEGHLQAAGSINKSNSRSGERRHHPSHQQHTPRCSHTHVSAWTWTFDLDIYDIKFNPNPCVRF